jgi:hypothetical protein
VDQLEVSARQQAECCPLLCSYGNFSIEKEMVNISFPDFQKCLSHQIASARRQCKQANKQHYDAGDTMEQVHVMFINIARIAGCTQPASEKVLNGQKS